MEKEKFWLKFIISGKAEDYINYSNKKREEEICEVDNYSLYNGCTGDRSKQYR